jgi:hypothetical protein
MTTEHGALAEHCRAAFNRLGQWLESIERPHMKNVRLAA